MLEQSQIIESLSSLVALGLSGVATTPLECLGLAGYVPRLLFWMITPFVLSVVIVVGVLIKRKLAKGGAQTTLIESVLPPFNLIMFPFTMIEWYIRWSITSLP